MSQQTPHDPKVAVAVGEVPAYPTYIYLDLRTEGSPEQTRVFLDADGAEGLGQHLLQEARRLRGDAAPGHPSPEQPEHFFGESEVLFGFTSAYPQEGATQAVQIVEVPFDGYVIHQYYGMKRPRLHRAVILGASDIAAIAKYVRQAERQK